VHPFKMSLGSSSIDVCVGNARLSFVQVLTLHVIDNGI